MPRLPTMIMPHRAAHAICPDLGRKGFRGGPHPCPKLAQHRLQQVIGADDKPCGPHLTGRMAVADVPGITREVWAGDLQHRLLGGDQLNGAAIFLRRLAYEHHRVAFDRP